MSEITFNENNPNGPIRRAKVDSEGRLLTFNDETITSPGNSSDVILGIGGSFTGVGELNNAPDVLFSVYTDQDGDFFAEFSTDNVNWDSSIPYKFEVGKIPVPHVLVKGPRYFRIRFVNTSGIAQTYFRLNVYFGQYSKLTASGNGRLSEDFDSLPVRPSDYHYEVALGKRQGSTTWNKYGYNPDADSGTIETVWSPGGIFQRITTPTTLDISSTSANDLTSTGTGAQSIIIYGVNENFEAITEVIQMNGLTNVTTTNLYCGVNRMAVYLVGTSEENVGTISAYVSGGGGTLQAQMPLGEGSTQQAIFFVQENHTMLLDFLFINVTRISGGGAQPTITIRGWVQSLVSGAKYEVFRDVMDTGVENHLVLNPQQPFVIGEKSILYFTVDTDTNNTTVGIRFSGVEVENL